MRINTKGVPLDQEAVEIVITEDLTITDEEEGVFLNFVSDGVSVDLDEYTTTELVAGLNKALELGWLNYEESN